MSLCLHLDICLLLVLSLGPSFLPLFLLTYLFLDQVCDFKTNSILSPPVFGRIIAVPQKLISLASYPNNIKTWAVSSEESLLDACGRFLCLLAFCVLSMTRLWFSISLLPIIQLNLAQLLQILIRTTSLWSCQTSIGFSFPLWRPLALVKSNSLFLSRISKCFEGSK